MHRNSGWVLTPGMSDTVPELHQTQLDPHLKGLMLRCALMQVTWDLMRQVHVIGGFVHRLSYGVDLS